MVTTSVHNKLQSYPESYHYIPCAQIINEIDKPERRKGRCNYSSVLPTLPNLFLSSVSERVKPVHRNSNQLKDTVCEIPPFPGELTFETLQRWQRVSVGGATKSVATKWPVWNGLNAVLASTEAARSSFSYLRSDVATHASLSLPWILQRGNSESYRPREYLVPCPLSRRGINLVCWE